ncbi:alpha/beta hydrolase [Gilvimarinus sp. SDUM040013]|uniref:Alpha/beta hydrolase n=1 Tax=Gilvimarinus gilvus TaxID=3058038 RepID=A0ABU4S3P2_9GAMM|nr:alpha/beta hydrolase [Gilvimarinus sp. SDUM040013]MDO3387821.1 alpha/beta hydrolase [Gilvimarinus sp. SDUM040013]MDX6851036.1 alpha/beta hydrolase [Gilvimarinus sp. SDUM040013]
MKKALWIATIFCSACSLQEIKQEADATNSAATIQGTLTTTEPAYQSYAGAFSVNDGHYLLRATAKVDGGSYSITLPPGDYAVGAYTDINGNGAFDADVDLSAYWSNQDGSPVVERLNANSVNNVPPLALTSLSSNKFNPDLHSRNYKALENMGRVVALSDPMFSDESAKLGVWQPLTYLETYGGGLMFLQEFEENKIPVIFVHGIFGSTTSFSDVIDGLDTSVYQPWVLQYPSGLSLGLISDYWVKAIDELSNTYKFDHFQVVAHSMGGVVTRDFVRKFSAQNHSASISKVITVNSPLMGMPSAQKGVKYSPIVVPSWQDVATDSDFITTLHQWSWPDDLDYTLVASYLPGEPGDGIVDLTSSTSDRLQNEASQFYLMQGEHTQSLSKPVLVNFLLDEIHSASP